MRRSVLVLALSAIAALGALFLLYQFFGSRGVRAEQAWLDNNLPDGDSERSSSAGGGGAGQGITLRHDDSFHVAAADADTWLFTVHHGIKDDASGYTREQNETCRAKYKSIHWSDSVLMPVVEDSGQPASADPNARAFTLLVPDTHPFLTCTSTLHETGKHDSTEANLVLALTFNSRQSAEAALALIIQHANSATAAAIAAEKSWIDTHLPVGDVRRGGPMQSDVGPVYLAETDSTQIYPLTLEDWRFHTLSVTHRTQGQEKAEFQTETVCNVQPRKVDWATASVSRYEPAFGNSGDPAFLVSVLGPKSVSCDVASSGSRALQRSENGHWLNVIFPSESDARTFLRNIRQLPNEPVAAAPAPGAAPQSKPSAQTPAPALPVSAPAPTSASALTVPAPTANQQAAPQDQIRAMLEQWADAESSNNLAESRFYAPRVDRYFLARNVSSDFVRRDKQRFLARGNRIRSFAISDLQIEQSSPGKAVVWLRKSYSLSRRGGTSGINGSTHSRLWLEDTADGWKITGEQDLK